MLGHDEYLQIPTNRWRPRASFASQSLVSVLVEVGERSTIVALRRPPRIPVAEPQSRMVRKWFAISAILPFREGGHAQPRCFALSLCHSPNNEARLSQTSQEPLALFVVPMVTVPSKSLECGSALPACLPTQSLQGIT